MFLLAALAEACTAYLNCADVTIVGPRCIDASNIGAALSHGSPGVTFEPARVGRPTPDGKSCAFDVVAHFPAAPESVWGKAGCGKGATCRTLWTWNDWEVDAAVCTTQSVSC